MMMTMMTDMYDIMSKERRKERARNEAIKQTKE
jgi:hypothetical protein